MTKPNFIYKYNLFDATTRRDVVVRLTALATVAILAVSCNDKTPDEGQLIAIVPSYQELGVSDPEASIEISPKVSEGTIATPNTASTVPTTPPTTGCLGGPVTNPNGQLVGTLPVSC